MDDTLEVQKTPTKSSKPADTAALPVSTNYRQTHPSRQPDLNAYGMPSVPLVPTEEPTAIAQQYPGSINNTAIYGRGLISIAALFPTPLREWWGGQTVSQQRSYGTGASFLAFAGLAAATASGTGAIIAVAATGIAAYNFFKAKSES